MKKALASVVMSIALVSGVGCTGWNKVVPSDNTTEAEIRKNLAGDHITGMSINVDNDTVTLEGTVKNETDHQTAIHDAQKVHGVARVIDHIKVQP
ncbi:MAG TPA: BON domain-containing protein [Thermoanaerobaculia bacterium]|jgi:osmotically-inducible protein OsmY|nr:BON domain-containing protein [Thermoanaerobaculia bacterium]